MRGPRSLAKKNSDSSRPSSRSGSRSGHIPVSILKKVPAGTKDPVIIELLPQTDEDQSYMTYLNRINRISSPSYLNNVCSKISSNLANHQEFLNDLYWVAIEKLSDFDSFEGFKFAYLNLSKLPVSHDKKRLTKRVNDSFDVFCQRQKAQLSPKEYQIVLPKFIKQLP